MIPFLATFSDGAILVLRLAVGVILVAHGWTKVKDTSGTASWFESVGFKPGKLWGGIAGILEFGGGLLLLVGLLVQPVALLLTLEFFVIMGWRMKRRDKLVHGYELDLILLTSLLALAALGSDYYALDVFVGPLLF